MAVYSHSWPLSRVYSCCAVAVGLVVVIVSLSMLLSSMWGWPYQSVMIATGVWVDSNTEKRYFRLDTYM